MIDFCRISKRTSPLVKQLRYTITSRSHSPELPREDIRKCSKSQIQQIFQKSGLQMMLSGSLIQSICRLFNIKETISHKLLVKTLHVLHENRENKQKCIVLLSDLKHNQNLDTITHSHASNLYELTQRIKESTMIMILQNLKKSQQLKQNRQIRTSTKCLKLYEDSKERNKRQQERTYHRLLKQLENQKQETGKIRKNVSKSPIQQKFKKQRSYQLLRSYKKKPIIKSRPILFQLNININGIISNVSITVGQSAREVVDKLKSEYEMTKELENHLQEMIQQYIDEHGKYVIIA